MEHLFLIDEIKKITNKRYRIHNKYINGYMTNEEYNSKIEKLMLDSEILTMRLAKDKKD